MRTTETITISLAPELAEILERLRKKEHRTRSELIREALRQYFYNQFPVYKPTKAERAAIKQGEEDFKKGQFVTLEQLHHELALDRNKASKKRIKKVS